MSDAPELKPRKSEARQRGDTFGLRFLPGEKAVWQARASAAGFASLADFIRDRCGAEPVRTTGDRRDLIRLQAELNRIGGNVNQLVKLAHLRGVADEYVLRVADLMEEAHRLIEAELARARR